MALSLKKIRFIKSRFGFTLIEIIVSLALLAIMSVTFLTMFPFTTKYIRKSGISSKTNYILQSIMEQKIIDTSIDVSSLETENILQTQVSTSLHPAFILVFAQTSTSYEIYGTKIDIQYKNGEVYKKITGLTNIR